MMHTLPLSFALLTYTGYWRPVGWPLTSIKYRAYNVYSVVMIFLLHSFTFCGLVDCFLIEDLETFIEKFSLFLSVLGVCCKVMNLVIRRNEIVGLIEMLLKDICLPRDNHEVDIQQRFDRTAKCVIFRLDHKERKKKESSKRNQEYLFRTITIYCEILNESAVFFATVAQFGHFANTHTLPLSDWVPYDTTSTAVYWATVLHQTIGLMVCANASVAHETLISGFMIQTCAQLDILCHRARMLPDSLRKEAEKWRGNVSKEDLKAHERRVIREFVHHHRYVYRLAERINSVFALMIFVQFTVSSTVLCLSIYKMSTKSLLSFEFVWSLSYLGCMLMQIYLYCWFGNEVTLKSAEVGTAVYEMDWTSFPVDLMKSLLLVAARSKKAIRITSGNIIALSNDSFMKVNENAVSRTRYNIVSEEMRNDLETHIFLWFADSHNILISVLSDHQDILLGVQRP
ncbi:PREDICTED: odorant receptor 94a-like [Dinoponera quadriceps]|uniref:Odorant receptor n=1 Tax=Dinoponera quadriceps TaxID=609295 RepID=A0A6P3XXM6_DINQU|nr:PREDICTED: odorant receptor 94a-like [Dinoponera quadriceps]